LVLVLNILNTLTVINNWVTNSDLTDGNARTALALTKVMVTLTVHLGARMHATAMTLANERLPHAHILVGFVSSFGKPDSR